MADADTFTPVPIRQVAALVAGIIQSSQFAGLDVSQATVGSYTMEDIAQAALGKSGLPIDVVNNGGVIMAGPTPLPDGYISNGGVIIQKSTPGE